MTTQDDLLTALVDRWRYIAQSCRAMAADEALEEHRVALRVAAVNREECAKELAAALAPMNDRHVDAGPRD